MTARLQVTASLIALVRRMPWLHKTTWRVRQGVGKAKRIVCLRRPVVDVGPLLAAAIIEKIPFATGKIGSVETKGLSAFLKRENDRHQGRTPHPYGAYAAQSLYTNAGIFPSNNESYDRALATLLAAVESCDALVAWDVAGEVPLLRDHASRATLVFLRSLEPYFSKNPWSAALAGKRVCVVSPFAQSIKQQYEKREKLWPGSTLLPAFDLCVIQAPLSAGLVPPRDADWTTALGRMKAEMDAVDYDVALIGAGAFSLPLAAHAKSRGKVGVHLGGSLQILFGILGKRWENNKDFTPFFNEAWSRPREEERPVTVSKVENACYW